MQNIEIKARCEDLKKAKAIAIKLGANFAGVDHQIDTYFKTSKGRLKLRQSSLKGRSELIPYSRLDQTGPKKSDYLLLSVDEPEKLRTLLNEILGLDSIVVKTREIYLLDNVRIHLDDVQGLGTFFEFEAVYTDLTPETEENTKVKKLMEKFEIKESDLIAGSYRELSRHSQHK